MLKNFSNVTVSAVNDTDSSVQLVAANANRKGLMIFNDSDEILYVLFGNGTASATNHSVQVAAGGYYELPIISGGGVFSGAMQGIWANDSTGAARMTELT